MKLTKVTIVITLIVVSSIFAAPGCPDVYKFGDSKTKVIKDTDQVFPTDQDNKTAKDNALKQTQAARGLFYKPGPDALNLIKTAAKNLIALYKSGKPAEDAFRAFVNSSFQRQTTKEGTAQENLLAALQAAYKSKITKLNDAEIGLGELIKNMENPGPADILAFLGLVGDFGASIQDTFGRKKFDPPQKAFASFMNTVVDNLEAKSADIYKEYSPDIYYGKEDKADPTKTQSKGKERMVCAAKEGNVDKEDKTCKDCKKVTRAGVMETGTTADTNLKTQKALPPIGWPWQTVPNKLIKYCATEPWAGHFSGSFYELVFMLELFSQTPDAKTKKYDAKKATDPKVKDAAISWGAAFLIGTGMHSAIEVAHVAMKMTGKATGNIDLADDKVKGSLCGSGASTTFISGLLSAQTGKRRLK